MVYSGRELMAKDRKHLQYVPDWSFELEAEASGYLRIAGVDEAGRGPLAGPVVAGAVVLPRDANFLSGLNDSKKLTEKKREALYEALASCPEVDWSVGIVTAEEIDHLNILKATHLAMARAVSGLKDKADFCLVDGLPVKGLPVNHRAIVKGDARSLSIAAASIFAKVTRDRMMIEAHALYPQYEFSKHKGYGTKSHMDALRKYGPCPLHRRSFAPIAQMELPIFG